MHVWLALALVLAPAPVPVAPADEAPAEPERDPAERAAELFGAGEFLEAAAAFEEAFAKTGDPAFVFGRAQALRRAGNCAAAIDELERFIDLAPPQNDIDEAKTVIASCRRVLGIEAKADAPEPVARPEPIPPPAPHPRPWHRDPAGAALLGSGLVLSAIGGGLLGGSFARARDRDETESAWESRGRGVRVLSTAGIVMLGAGGALVIAGVIRWAVVARRNRTSGPAPVARH